MKFYNLREIPMRSDDVVFRASPIGRFIPFIVFSGMEIALVLFGIVKKHPGMAPPLTFFIYLWAAFLALFVLVTFAQFRASLQPANWLLRCNGSGIVIKYRSYLNWRFPAEDAQAVGFDYSEIAWVRTVKERRASADLSGKKQSRVLTYLDFCLVDSNTSALEAHLQSEQNLQTTAQWRANDYPVEVLSGGIIQVRWNSISPAVVKAIEYLRRYVKIADAETTKVNLTGEGNLSPKDQDAKILTLIKSGDKMGAVRLTRQIYGSSLSEAVAFVEKLQSGG